MATSLTFSTLMTDLKRYTQRGSATADATVIAEFPRIINRAEISLARRFKVQGFQNTVTGTLPTNGVLAKPADWLDTISIGYGASYTPLLPRSYEYCRMYWPDPTEKDAPEFYADYDEEHWFFAPIPDQAYDAEFLYHATPVLLDTSNEENWLTEKVPDLLLYECLIHAGPFVGWNAAKTADFTKLRDDAANSVNVQDLLKVIDRSTKRRSA